MAVEVQTFPPVPQLRPPTLLVTVPPTGTGVMVTVAACAAVKRANRNAATRLAACVRMTPPFFFPAPAFCTPGGVTQALRGTAGVLLVGGVHPDHSHTGAPTRPREDGGVGPGRQCHEERGLERVRRGEARRLQ